MTPPAARAIRVAGVAAAVVAAVVGAGMILVGATVGHCSAFGGSCPADPPPLWEDDVFGMAATGAALVVGPLLALRRRSRRWPTAVGGAAAAALVVGLLVRSVAHG